MKCLKCGAELPEGSKFCLECGNKLEDDENVDELETNKEIILNESNEEDKFGSDINHEVELNETGKENIPTEKRTKSKRNYLIIGIVIVVIAVISVFGYKNHQEKLALEAYNERIKEYKADLFSFRLNILKDGAKFEEMCNKYLEVWHDAIFESKKDFNDEIEKQYKVYEKENEELKTSKESLDRIVKRLQDSPEGYEKTYDAVLEMYEVYDEFYRLATSPNGSYQSYSDDVHEVDSKFLNTFNKLDILIPDKENNE